MSGGEHVGAAAAREAVGARPARPAAPGMALSCEAVSFSYAEAGTAIPALREVSFALRPGASLALLGPSGAGKSTLLQVVRGLYEPEAGAVRLDGRAQGDADHAARQRETGLVFQVPELQLFAATARDDVAFGPRQLGWPAEAVDAAVAAALELVALPEWEYGQRHPYTLSGGEQRRLALAGVLAMRPRLLLLDEPFVSLDPGSRRELAAILERLRDQGVTMVLATHDVDLAWALCDERVVLAGGRVAAAGDWELGGEGAAVLAANRLRMPFLADLWRRLGRDVGTAPRTAAEAAEALA